MSRIMDEVQGDCTFEFYRDGALHYRTAHGFVFPVPAADAGSATFGATEKGITLMRWIRKALAVVEEGKEAAANQPRPIDEVIDGWQEPAMKVTCKYPGTMQDSALPAMKKLEIL